MNRIFIIFLTFVLCMSLHHNDATASLISIGEGEGSPGTTVILPVLLSNDDGIVAIDVDISYDAAKLEVASDTVVPGSAVGVSQKTLEIDTAKTAPGTLSFTVYDCIDSTCSNIIQSGEIARVPFYIKPTAPSGATDIAISRNLAVKYNGTDFIGLASGTSSGTISINGSQVLTGGTGYGTLTDAYAAAIEGAEVKAVNTAFTENLNMYISKTISLNGGYAPGFGSITGFTTVSGTVTVAQGSVTINNIIIR